ncbi:uncharacterized protein LOC143846537 [Tasmannia lanceolata]|uniref:uncharacterized protein LOC143846537 n=1 Tax=Tasmannia lanceolata TaxID=3420 RepID=UPI004063B0C4
MKPNKLLKPVMNTTTGFLLVVLLASSASFAVRVESFANDLKKSEGGFFGPGGNLGVPGFSIPEIPFGKGGTVRPTITCTEKGPCFKKKLTCPAKCFTSYSRSGKNYGGGGGGGGCTMDCKKKCIAYC